MKDNQKLSPQFKRAAFAACSSAVMLVIAAVSYAAGDAETAFVAGSGAAICGWMAHKTYTAPPPESGPQ